MRPSLVLPVPVLKHFVTVTKGPGWQWSKFLLADSQRSRTVLERWARHGVAHHGTKCLSCTSPHTPTFFRHDEISLVMIKARFAVQWNDAWCRSCLMVR